MCIIVFDFWLQSLKKMAREAAAFDFAVFHAAKKRVAQDKLFYTQI